MIDMIGVICEYCKNDGKTSTVLHGTIRSTLAYNQPWSDEAGRTHYHNTNRSTQSFTCSNGHKFEVITGPGTCWCGWNG